MHRRHAVCVRVVDGAWAAAGDEVRGVGQAQPCHAHEQVRALARGLLERRAAVVEQAQHARDLLVRQHLRVKEEKTAA
jgi:hypothetical protein